MAEFGANATGTYETPNFIRPQEGVQDRSAEGLLRAAGSGLEQGIELTSAFKGREFRGELDAAVNQEIGMKIASTQEAKPSDTQEFRDAIERAKQVYAQGGAGTRMRTNLLAEKLTREKAGANPLFANVYRQVAREVLSDYDATLQFWTAAEESAAKQSQSEAAGKNDLVKSVYRMHERAGGFVPFTKPPETMTMQELQDYIVVAGKVARDTADEKRTRELLAEQRDLLKTNAATQGAVASMTAANIALEERNISNLELSHANTVQAGFDSEFDSKVVRGILDRITSGKLSTINPEFKSEILVEMSAIRSRINQQLNSTGYTTEAGMRRADNVRSHMESRFTELERLVNGPFSELQAYADLNKSIQDKVGVDAYVLAPDIAVAQRALGPQAIGMVVSDILMGEGPLRNSIRTSMDQGIKDLFSSATKKQSSKGDLSRMPTEHSSILRRNAISRAASIDPKEMSYISDPDTFGINFVAGTDAIEVRGPTLSGEEIRLLLDGIMTKNFVQQYESLKTSDPSQALRVADRYHDTARYIAPAALKTILQKASGNFGINPENGYFVTDLPDMRVKTLVNQMNALVDGLVATKEQDRTAPQDELEARLYFIEEFFR